MHYSCAFCINVLREKKKIIFIITFDLRLIHKRMWVSVKFKGPMIFWNLYVFSLHFFSLVVLLLDAEWNERSWSSYTLHMYLYYIFCLLVRLAHITYAIDTSAQIKGKWRIMWNSLSLSLSFFLLLFLEGITIMSVYSNKFRCESMT